MRKLALVSLAAVAVAVLRGRGRDPGLRPRRRHGLEPPGGSVDLAGSDSRTTRTSTRSCRRTSRTPRRSSRTGSRAKIRPRGRTTTRSAPSAQVRHLRRQERRRQAGHHLLLPVQEPARRSSSSATRSSATRSRRSSATSRRSSRQRPDDSAGQHRPARRRRTTTLSRRRASTRSPTARPCSQASVTTRSSRTSARSSTSWRFATEPAPTGGGKDFLGRLRRPRDRVADPEVAARQRRQPHDRRLGGDRPAEGEPCRNGKAVGRLGAGLAPRQPADQRGPDPDEPQGSLERQPRRRTTSSSRSTTRTRSWRRCCRSCTRSSGRSRTRAAAISLQCCSRA